MKPTTITAPPIVTSTPLGDLRHFWVVLGRDYQPQDGHPVPTQTEERTIALSEGETISSYFAHWIEDGWQIEASMLAPIDTPENATEQEEF